MNFFMNDFCGYKYSKKQKLINLYHGIPVKKIRLLDATFSRIGKKLFARETKNYSALIVSSEIEKYFMSVCFGMHIKKVYVSGSPRLDIIYKTNQQNDDKDFIARFICLGLPVVVRIFVVIMPVYLIISVIGYSFNIGISYDASGNEIYETSIIDVVITIIFITAYYQYLSNKIGLIKIENSRNNN